MDQMFTAMSDDGIDAVQRAIMAKVTADKPYVVEFTAHDLGMFVLALKNAYEHASDMGCEGTDDIDLQDGEAAEWSASRASAIAEHMGIEFI